MAGPKKFIHDETKSLAGDVDLIDTVLIQWKKHVENGTWPADPIVSITTMQRSIASMREHVDTINDIVDSTLE
jgi:hypothetical protein